MKINFNTCNEKELWEYVALHLKKNGIDTVLVGGAVVSIYSQGAYQSGDLDLIKTSMFVSNLDEVMKDLGFKRHGRHFVHPDCKQLFIEFPSGPLGIGEDHHLIPDEITVEGTVIKILSPTDCVKDRLASYIHFNAREGLDQAVLVAQSADVNLSKVKKWCKEEGFPTAFDEFLTLLKK